MVFVCCSKSEDWSKRNWIGSSFEFISPASDFTNKSGSISSPRCVTWNHPSNLHWAGNSPCMAHLCTTHLQQACPFEAGCTNHHKPYGRKISFSNDGWLWWNGGEDGLILVDSRNWLLNTSGTAQRGDESFKDRKTNRKCNPLMGPKGGWGFSTTGGPGTDCRSQNSTRGPKF